MNDVLACTCARRLALPCCNVTSACSPARKVAAVHSQLAVDEAYAGADPITCLRAAPLL